MRSYVMELIGTCFLVMAVGLTGNPFAIGIILMVMIYVGGHVSGAHYNPAVSLAVYLRGKLPAKELTPYIASQIAGAFIGAFLVYLLTNRTFAPVPAEGVEVWVAILAEILFTFALASVVLNVATSKKLEGNHIYGLAIGFTVLASAFCVGGISGGAFNPAVAIGPGLFAAMKGGNHLNYVYIYLIGCFAGGALAAFVFKYLNPED